MILQISWRNIWRNKMRSWMVILAMTLGIWAVAFVIAFLNSFYILMIDAAIENQVSHIQIHHEDYKEDKMVKFYMDDGEKALEKAKSLENVKAATSRLLVAQGMIKTAKGSRGVIIKGVDPEMENEVTKLKQKIDTGSFFMKKAKNPIVIGKVLADKLKLKLRSSVVLMFQDADGEEIRAKFRVQGIYSTGFSIDDRMNVFVKKKDLARLFNFSNEIHEVALLVDNLEDLPKTIDELKKIYPERAVESYKEVSPLVSLMEGQMETTMAFILGIILAAMGFGIVNTMLMAVLERMRELGVLMAIGMNKKKIFSMIVMETTILGVVGGPLGLALGFLSISYFNYVGVDFSQFSEGLEQFGVSKVIRPVLGPGSYVATLIAVVFTAIISSIYPAIKALKLNPAESIQKV